METPAENIELTLSGIVTATQWDEEERVVRVSLHTNDEREYSVEPDAAGRRLLGLVRERVRVTGKIRRDPGGRVWLKILTCRPLE